MFRIASTQVQDPCTWAWSCWMASSSTTQSVAIGKLSEGALSNSVIIIPLRWRHQNCPQCSICGRCIDLYKGIMTGFFFLYSFSYCFCHCILLSWILACVTIPRSCGTSVSVYHLLWPHVSVKTIYIYLIFSVYLCILWMRRPFIIIQDSLVSLRPLSKTPSWKFYGKPSRIQ